MHELAITKQLIDSICKESNKPKKVFAELGSLTSFKKEPILFYFDQLKAEFPKLEKTTLQIKEISAEIECKECNKKSSIKDLYQFFCPKCESAEVSILKGKEFVITKIIEEKNGRRNSDTKVSDRKK